MSIQTDRINLPEHIAIIMDGNGRWAKKKGAMRVFGHQSAVKAVREATEGCAELGVKYLTLYAFSTENWNRPQEEVNALMELLVSTIGKELSTLHENNVRLNAIGDLASLPAKCQRELQEAIQATQANSGLILTLALSYSGRTEILQAARKLAEEVQSGKITADEITEESFAHKLYTHAMPDPELLIRTSGEQRISNFLLWQIAYTELYITEVLWPDFRKQHLNEAIRAFQSRERRFGKTSEQIQTNS